MQLAAKLILLFLAGILLVVGIFSYATIQSDKQLAILEHQQRAKTIAEAVSKDPDLRVTLDQWIQPRVIDNNQSWRVQSRIRIIEIGSSGRPVSTEFPKDFVLKQKEITTVTRTDEFGQPRFYSYLPLTDGSSSSVINQRIEVSDTDHQATQRIRRSLVSSIVALLGVTSLSGVIIWIGGVRMVGRPLTLLTEKVQRIGQGDFTDPVELKTKDELARLGDAINEMCTQLSEQRDTINQETQSKLEAIEHLRHSDRLTSVGQMAAGFAHEIGTPLNVILGRAELIATGSMPAEQIQKNAETIKQESQRISKIVRSLLDFSRPTKPHRQQVDLKNLLQKTCDTLQPLAKKECSQILLHTPNDNPNTFIDPIQIEQVLTNLIINGIQSTGDQGTVDISLGSETRQEQGGEKSTSRTYHVITLTDNGMGMSVDQLKRIFDPFFTTKTVGDGTGLGLSIAHGIVREHDGWIDVESDLGQGSTFRVFLPSDQTSSP